MVKETDLLRNAALSLLRKDQEDSGKNELVTEKKMYASWCIFTGFCGYLFINYRKSEGRKTYIKHFQR
jgi:hypothetical protein